MIKMIDHERLSREEGAGQIDELVGGARTLFAVFEDAREPGALRVHRGRISEESGGDERRVVVGHRRYRRR